MNDPDFLKLAIEKAKESIERGGFPAGAILVKDKKVIVASVSLGFLLHDPTSHAETVSVRDACQKLKTTDLSSCTLYASLQPCMMCFGSASWAGISRIVYGCRKTKEMVKKKYYEGSHDIEMLNKACNHPIQLEYLAEYEDAIKGLIEQWEDSIKTSNNYLEK